MLTYLPPSKTFENPRSLLLANGVVFREFFHIDPFKVETPNTNAPFLPALARIDAGGAHRDVGVEGLLDRLRVRARVRNDEQPRLRVVLG